MRRAIEKFTFGCAVSAALAPNWASAKSGALLDTMASVLAVFVIIVVPVAGIAVFWMVHVLPEKIAERRHHPQKEAIKVLCLLSLVFGGMLWPIAWLWAYSRPVLHKMAYGRDRHDDYYAEPGDDESADSASLRREIARLRLEIQSLSGQEPHSGSVQTLERRNGELGQRHT